MGSEWIVIGKTRRCPLRVILIGSHLDGKIGVVFARKKGMGHFVQFLNDARGMVLAYANRNIIAFNRFAN